MISRAGAHFVLASVLVFALAAPAVAASGQGAPGASCSVSPTTATIGSGIVVTVSGITRHTAHYGWFAVRDTGPTEGQAVSTFDVPPAYGDNGSYVIDWDAATGVAHFAFTVQPDPGVHVVTAEYRKTFATCTYLV